MKQYFYPSNGTEGAAFERKWCDHCTRDAAFRADHSALGCEVLAYATAGEKPVEAWVFQDGEAVCTEFAESPDNPQRCRFTLDLFKDTTT